MYIVRADPTCTNVHEEGSFDEIHKGIFHLSNDWFLNCDYNRIHGVVPQSCFN